MRKFRSITAVLLMLALVLSVAGFAGAEGRKIESAADADEWIAVFLGDHPEELEGVWAMTDQMETAAARMGGIGAMAGQMAALGTAEEIGAAYEGEMAGYTVYRIPCVFSAMEADLILVVQDGAIAGLQTGPYTGSPKEEAGAAEYDAIELPLEVPGLGKLPGILAVPKGKGPFPVVILLQGSGASDKDETIGKLKPFRDITEGLAEQGVAVYRFDKRTYTFGAVLAAKKDFTPEDEYLEDAVNAVRLMAGQDRIDPDRIYVLGHSLGGNMIPAVDRALEGEPVKARGYIMMAASPRPMDVLMREQTEFLYSLLPEVTAEQAAAKDELFAELDRLQDLDSLAEDEAVAGAYPAYWKWLADYDMLQAADGITEPVLLLQGEEDYQVTMEDFGILGEALGPKENWRMVSFPGLTHIFTPGQKAEGSAFYDGDGKVAEGVILEIAAFILGQ